MLSFYPWLKLGEVIFRVRRWTVLQPYSWLQLGNHRPADLRWGMRPTLPRFACTLRHVLRCTLPQEYELSHVRIVRSARPLGGLPVDVLVRILDVAGLAVDAVLRVDLVAHA